MLKTVVIAKNPFEPESWETFEVEDVCALLAEQFVTFPDTAKIYHEQVAQTNDVTPNSEASIERLQRLTGTFYVVVFPEDAATAAYIVVAIVAAVVAVALTSNIAQPRKTDNNTPSPNNDLAARQNKARPLQRIPDIYGTVRATPDLIALPYTVYENNVEVEYAYMCLGRGYFHVIDMRDDTTPLETIAGAKALVFDPYMSPNAFGPYPPPPGSDANLSGVTYAVGTDLNERVRMVRRMTSVNGQQLYAPGDTGGEVFSHHSTSGMFIRPWHDSEGYCIKSTGTGAYDLSDTVAALNPGDGVGFFGVFFDGDHINYDFGGNYAWDSSSTNNASRIGVIVPPGDPWAEWNVLMGSTHGALVYNEPASPITSPTTAFIEDPDITSVWVNIVATNGMYQIASDGTTTEVDASIQIVCQPADADGNPVGTPQTVTEAITGRADKGSIGLTYKIVLTTPGPTLVTVNRTTPSPVNTQVMDTLQWKDLYGVAEVGGSNFGYVTTVQTVTRATAGALAVKERKLNMLVQRLTPTRASGFGVLAGTNNFAQSLMDISRDQYLGNRPNGELDMDNWEYISALIQSYFHDSLAAEFCYTFDSSNLSYEEMVQQVCSAVFSFAYRQGNMMRLTFERLNPDSTMLFGHRNKLPGSERRTLTFGAANNYDCVAFNYVSPTDDAPVTLYVPIQGVNPQKIDSIGVRNYHQAYFQAWRAWNKIKYANTTTEFTATQEAALLLMADRILVADNTRSGSQDGEVVAQVGLVIQLSQPVTFVAGHSYHIFLQLSDGTVESIAITPGANEYQVTLGSAPTLPLIVDDNASVKTLYWVVANDDTRPQAFLVNKREPGDASFTEKVTAINYDDRYYGNDDDVYTGSIPADPNG